MWAEIVKEIATYPSGVLSGRDADGYPYSARCTPDPDHAAQTLRLTLAEDIPLQPGPASILCHSHDALIDKLHSANVRGILERDARGWYLRPTAFIPDFTGGGLVAMIRTLRRMRGTADRYLKDRNLPTPIVPWARINAAKKEAVERAHR